MSKSASTTTRALHPDAMSNLAALMHRQLENHGVVNFTITGGIDHVDGGAFASAHALTEFAECSVDFRPGLTERQFVHALAHELVHLDRGPAAVDKAADEERTVEAIAQGLLYGETPAAPAVPTQRVVLTIARDGSQ